jgi:hypothetical protein
MSRRGRHRFYTLPCPRSRTIPDLSSEVRSKDCGVTLRLTLWPGVGRWLILGLHRGPVRKIR